MLILNRKSGQQVMIGRHIEVTVLRVQGNHVKLGIVGPADVPIRRSEIDRTKAALPHGPCAAGRA